MVIVKTDTDGSIVFTVPAGSKATRWRIAKDGAYSDWVTSGMTQDTTNGTVTVTVPAANNAIGPNDTVTTIVVELDIGFDYLSSTYIIVSDEPLSVMGNSFMTMPEAISLAASRQDANSFLSSSYVDKIVSMSNAFNTLVGYRYFIYYERNDWGARQVASWGLPFIDEYQNINNMRSMDASDFALLKPDFVRAIKIAQLLAADDAISAAQAAFSSPVPSDPNLIMEKIGDTSRTWKSLRDKDPIIGQRAMTIISPYLRTAPRLTRV